MKQNDAKIEAKKSGLEKSKDDELVKKLAAEKKINETRAAKLAKKQAELAAKEEAAAQAEAPVTEPVAEATSTPAEDKPEQQPAEEAKPQE